MLNHGKYIYKQSRFEKIINMVYATNIAMMITFIAYMSMRNYIWLNAHVDKLLYIYTEPETDITEVTFKVVFSFFLLFIRFVPLDLILVLEIIKIWYGSFIEYDATMIEITESGLRSCRV